MQIAERLKHVQQVLKLSNIEIAKTCGVSDRSVGNYLGSDRIPRIEFILRFCEAYKVNPNWLLLGEGTPFRDEEEFTYVARVDVRLGAGGEAEIFEAEPKEVYAFRKDWLLQKGNPRK